MRSFRKTFLAGDSLLVDSYLLPGFGFLLQTATTARTGGDLPLPSLFTTLDKEQPKVLALAFLGLLSQWLVLRRYPHSSNQDRGAAIPMAAALPILLRWYSLTGSLLFAYMGMDGQKGEDLERP
jgi:hypothetical protein